MSDPWGWQDAARDVLALLDAIEAADAKLVEANDLRRVTRIACDAAEARVVLLEAQLDKLLPIARQIVHSNDVVTDPQATNAARTSASMSEQEGVMCLAEWLAAVSVADSGPAPDTSCQPLCADGRRLSE